MQCKIGKVIGNLHALQQLLPATVDSVAVVQYMPMLLLSNMKKVRARTFISTLARSSAYVWELMDTLRVSNSARKYI